MVLCGEAMADREVRWRTERRSGARRGDGVRRGARLRWAKLLVQLQCRRKLFDLTVLCCSAFASGGVAMHAQQKINGIGRDRSHELLEAVLMHGFVGPCINAAVGPRQQAARCDPMPFFARIIGRGHFAVRMEQETGQTDRYGSFYSCASGGLFHIWAPLPSLKQERHTFR